MAVWGFPIGKPHPIHTFLNYYNRLTTISKFSPLGKEKSPLPTQGSCLRKPLLAVRISQLVAVFTEPSVSGGNNGSQAVSSGKKGSEPFIPDQTVRVILWVRLAVISSAHHTNLDGEISADIGVLHDEYPAFQASFNGCFTCCETATG